MLTRQVPMTVFCITSTEESSIHGQTVTWTWGEGVFCLLLVFFFRATSTASLRKQSIVTNSSDQIALLPPIHFYCKVKLPERYHDIQYFGCCGELISPPKKKLALASFSLPSTGKVRYGIPPFPDTVCTAKIRYRRATMMRLKREKCFESPCQRQAEW